MRRLLPIFLSLCVLVTLFALYLKLQPQFGGTLQRTLGSVEIPASDAPPISAQGGLQPGSGAWAVKYDHDTGKRSYQFKSDFFDNQPDGSVKVTRPVIEFFLSNGQVLEIKGEDGLVTLPPGSDSGPLTGGGLNQPPQSGSLRNVTVRLFPTLNAMRDDADELTMTMTNARFDNDTYRLYTQEYVDAQRNIVHADEVPVQVKSKDYDFDGSGLVLYWNDLDKKLKSLEIAHGKKLTIYNAQAASLAGENSGPPTAASPPAEPPTAAVPPEPVVPSTMPSIPAPRQRYTVTLFQNVQVIQANELIASAPERLDVDFAMRSDSAGQGTASSPIANPRNDTSPQATAPSTNPSRDTSSLEPPATRTTAPMIVYWTGKLTMVPTDEAVAEPLADGKAVLHMSGSPVRVHQKDLAGLTTDIFCSDLNYHTADASINLRGAGEVPVVLRQKRADGIENVVRAPTVNFTRTTDYAVLGGPGEAALPDPNQPASVLDARWGKNCTVRLYETRSGQMQIGSADLLGDVKITHPRFKLSAHDDVTLNFDRLSSDAKSSSPPLRQIIATGNAYTFVPEANGNGREISGQYLELLRDPGPDGKLYARSVKCDGGATASEAGQEIEAGHLLFLLKPALSKSRSGSNDDMGQATLDRLQATQDVRVTGKEGSSAYAAVLDVLMVNNHPRITLTGSAEHPAEVDDKSTHIVGPEIHVAPDDQLASVVGAGSLDAQQQPTDGKGPPRPLHLTWSESALLNGSKNEILVKGDAHAQSHIAGSTDDSSNSDSILVSLADTAADAGAPSPAPDNPPGPGNTVQLNFMKNKQVRMLSLLSETRAQTESTLLDAAGAIVHRYDLWGRRIDYLVTDKRLEVNGPGDLLAYQPASAPAAGVDTDSGVGSSGKTNIRWQDRFFYDDAKHLAQFDGSIEILHEEIGAASPTVRLTCEEVKALFEAGSNNAPAAGQAAPPHLSSVIATGNVEVSTTANTVKNCASMEFNPATSVLTCRAAPEQQVTIIDNKTGRVQSFDMAMINLKTNTIEKVNNLNAQ